MPEKIYKWTGDIGTGVALESFYDMVNLSGTNTILQCKKTKKKVYVAIIITIDKY